MTGHATHGHGRRGDKSPTYVSWECMRRRCDNPKRKRWKDYGGRGIAVCPRWSSFANFLTDMGERPEGKTLDRIDNAGDYEPGNCRWSTRSEQCRNSRRNRYVTLHGQRMLLVEAIEHLGVGWDPYRLARLNHGGTAQDAINHLSGSPQ